jgi:hypothetical protein
MLELILWFLSQPNHYFTESFVLDVLGVLLWIEQLIV